MEKTGSATANAKPADNRGQRKTKNRGNKNRNAALAVSDSIQSAIDEQCSVPNEHVVTQNVQMVVLPKDTIERMVLDRNLLTEENKKLRERLAELQGEAEGRHSKILAQELELSVLRRENEELRIHIKKFEDEMSGLRQEVSELKQSEMNTKHRMLELEIGQEFSKFMVVIQDLNDALKLEKSLPIPFNGKVWKLRSCRVAQCHYILDDDTADVKIFKQHLIVSKLGGMTGECSSKFDAKFGVGFINAVIAAPIKVSVSIPAEDEADAVEWWEI
jgi:hypothetical protein